MFGTYKPEDVTILLKDITGLVEPMNTWEREARIQQGVHYCEMLPMEYQPSPAYLAAYRDALERYASTTALAAARVAEEIWLDKGPDGVLVSLARAGTSIGVLLKRYIALRHRVSLPHYTISIIRGRGIDRAAMAYLLKQYRPEQLQFVDGWTGKGAIQRELDRAMADCPGVDPGLAVLSDPGGLAGKRGTREDFLIASSCLNSTVSGLLSRTFLRSDIIGPGEFHGAAFYRELLDQDLTYGFIDTVADRFPEKSEPEEEPAFSCTSAEEVAEICRTFGIEDQNLVKPGIGEATRVLLRRMPWKLLVHSLEDRARLGHLYRLAEEKGVPLEVYPLQHYLACGLIQKLADS